MANIAVVGSLHMDVIVNSDRRPLKGETLKGEKWALRAGGKGGNQAVQAARQGATVHMIGRVGRDDFGDKVLEALQSADVDTTHVFIDDSAGSGMSVAIIDNEGDYGAVIVSGANLNIHSEDIDHAGEIIANADSLILQYEIPLETVAYAAAYARRHGTKVILNAAPAYPAPAGLLENIDILVVNAVEAEMLAGFPVTSGDKAEKAARMLQESIPTVILTLGSRGSLVYDAKTGMQHIPAYTVKVVDTHGAGDAFIGALVTQLSDSAHLIDAVRYASATAALTVQCAGPQSADITAARVKEFMQANE